MGGSGGTKMMWARGWCCVHKSAVTTHRHGRLLTDNVTEDLGIAVDFRYGLGDLNAERLVIVKGFRPNETIAGRLFVTVGLSYPISMHLWCGVLRDSVSRVTSSTGGSF
mmetsp:Transcript_19368/g.55544  ORF Transcript_19368/g.55544 Transcript_19368/m.55544 type:complete len:109 (-) Transcript_19368:1889-2215(-)